jgi:hypothetical protein
MTLLALVFLVRADAIVDGALALIPGLRRGGGRRPDRWRVARRVGGIAAFDMSH